MALRDCIQYSDGDASERMLEILHIYQVINSRDWSIQCVPLESGDFRSGGGDFEYDIGEYSQIRHVVDWTTLKYVAETLFNFSRGVGDVERRDESCGFLPPRGPSYSGLESRSIFQI